MPLRAIKLKLINTSSSDGIVFVFGAFSLRSNRVVAKADNASYL